MNAIPIVFRTEFRRAFQRGIVDVDNSESYQEAVNSLEVVKQTPEKVSFDRDAVRNQRR